MSEAVIPEPVQIEKVKGRWRSLLAMSFSSVIDYTEGGLINSLFPVMRDALGMSLSALGIFSSISRFARMLFGPAWAMVADKYGRKRVLIFVTGIWGIWTGLAGLAQDYTQLLILYSIGVIGTVASEPIANGIIVDLFESKERGKAYGAMRSLTGLVGIMFTPIIGQFANIENGWRYGMFLMGGLSVFSGLIMLIFLKVPEGKEKNSFSDEKFEWGKVKELTKIKTFLLLGGTLVFVTSLVLFSFLVTFMVDVRGFTNADANIVMAAFGLGFMISSLLGGLLGDWFERRSPDKGRIMLMQVYLALFAIFSFLAMQIEWSTTGYYVIWFLFGLVGSIGFSGVVQPMLAAVVPPEMSGTAFSLLFSFFQGLLSALLSLAAGFFAERYGLQAVMFWMITVPYALNIFYWFLLYKTYPKDVAARKLAAAQE